MSKLSGKASRRIAKDKERIAQMAKWLLVALCVQFLLYLVLLNGIPFMKKEEDYKDLNGDGKITLYEAANSFYTETWYRYKGAGASEEIDNGMQFIHSYNIIFLVVEIGICVYYLIVIMEEYEGSLKERIKQFFKENKGLFFLLLFMTWVFISSLLAYDKFRSFIGCYNLRDGFISFMFYGSVLTCVLLLGKNNIKAKKLITNLFLITATVIAILTIWNYYLLVNHDATYVQEHYPVVQKYGMSLMNITSSVFNNSNHYGYFLSIAVIVAAVMFVRAGHKRESIENKIIDKTNSDLMNEDDNIQLVSLNEKQKKELVFARIGLHLIGIILTPLIFTLLFFVVLKLFTITQPIIQIIAALLGFLGPLIIGIGTFNIIEKFYETIKQKKMLKWGYSNIFNKGKRKKGEFSKFLVSEITGWIIFPIFYLVLFGYGIIALFSNNSFEGVFLFACIINPYILIIVIKVVEELIFSIIAKFHINDKKRVDTSNSKETKNETELAFISEPKGIYLLKASVYLACFCILVYMLILNDTFGSYLGVVFGIVFMLITALVTKKGIIPTLTIVVIFVLLSAFVQNSEGIYLARRNFTNTTNDVKKILGIYTPEEKNENVEETENAESSENVEPSTDAAGAGSGRYTLWMNTAKIVLGESDETVGGKIKTFFFGKGLENLIYILKNENGEGEGRSHSLLFQLAGTVGVPGMLLYFAGIGWIFISNLKNMKKWDTFSYMGMAVIVSYLISSMMGNSGFYTSGYFYIFVGFVVLGMMEMREKN